MLSDEWQRSRDQSWDASSRLQRSASFSVQGRFDHSTKPMVFDFDKPAERNLTEAVRTYALTSRFVIADISGYTDFIVKREISLLHAEQVITDLLEAMIGCADHPLVLNKLEGDAAFMFSDAGQAPEAAVADAMMQVGLLFAAFARTQSLLATACAGCDCGACSNIGNLRVKVFVHAGEVALKQVRQFEELAGEPVIVIHRMMKNTVSGHEYVLLSDEIVRSWPLAAVRGQEHRESFDGFGELRLRVLQPADLVLE